MAWADFVKYIQLDKTWLMNGLPGVTPATAEMCAEAAAVCWEYNGHGLTVSLEVTGDVSETYDVTRTRVDDQMRRSYADHQDAVEFAACAVAFMLIVEETSYTVVQRSWKGTGFDYWLGEKTDRLFQEKARLEVSGIMMGDSRDVSRRVKQKSRQVMNHESPLPAYIVVAEFSKPQAEVSYHA